MLLPVVFPRKGGWALGCVSNLRYVVIKVGILLWAAILILSPHQLSIVGVGRMSRAPFPLRVCWLRRVWLMLFGTGTLPCLRLLFTPAAAPPAVWMPYFRAGRCLPLFLP